MNRIKTSIITLLLCCIVIFGSIKPVHCGLGSFLFGKWLDNTTQSMANEMVEGLGTLVSTGSYEIGDNLVKSITKSFGPDIECFARVLSGASIASGTKWQNTRAGLDASSVSGIKRLNNVASVFGFTIAIFIFGFSLFIYFFAEPGSIRDTPFRLVIRLAIAMFLIWNAGAVMDIFMESADKIWTDYVMTGAVAGNEVGDTSKFQFSDLLVGYAKDLSSGSEIGNTIIDYVGDNARDTKQLIDLGLFGVTIVGSLVTIGPLAAFAILFIIIISWPMIKGFFKFYIEIIERYLVVMLLYFFFGAAAGTVVSKNSSRIMWSYLQMFACQVFLLFANVAFMAIFIETLKNGGFTSSIPNYIFGLAFLRICQKIDSYMAMLGLNVAQTGGQTLDTIGGVARNMIGAAKTATRTVQNGAKIGGQAALASGNAKLAAGLNAVSGVQGASQVAASGGFKFNKGGKLDSTGTMMAALDMCAKTGNKMHVDSPLAASVMEQYLANTSNQALRGRVNSMNIDSQKAGVREMLAKQGLNLDISSIDTADMMRGTIGFTGKTADGKDITGKLSSKSEPGNLQVGTNAFLSTENSLASTPNKMVKGTAATLGLASGTTEYLKNADKSFTDKISGMSYNPDTNSFNLYNAANNQIGTITNKNGQGSVVHAMNAGTGKNGSEKILSTDKVNKKIEKANGFVEGTLEWDTNKSSAAKGKYVGHAKAENEYGEIKDVDVVGFDIGKNSEKVGYRGGTMTTLDDDMHQMLILRRLQKGLDTEASGGEK